MAVAMPAIMAAQTTAKLTSNTILDLMNLRQGPSKTKMVKSAQKDGNISAYIKYNDASCLDSLSYLSVKVHTVTPTILTASIPPEAMDAVVSLSSVECIEAAQPAHMMMDKARNDTRVSDIHTPSAPLKTPFSGKGTIVGVIDGGVDFTHPAFFGPDGTTLRIKRVWCQDDDKGTAPVKYGYGSEYATQDDITKKGTDMQYYSHGCHVMGIAAGSDMTSPYFGVAYDADLAFAHFKDVDTGISDAISYIFEYADECDKPAVINMSLGTEMGPHDGSSLRDQLIDNLSGKGRIVVGAAGNNALINMHISKTFGEDETLFAGLGFLEDMSGIGELQVWGDENSNLKVRVVTVDKTTMQPVYQSRAFNCNNSYNGTITLQKPYDQSSGYFSIVTQRSPLNNCPMAHIQLAISDYKPTKVLAIIVTAEPGSTVHAWTNENYCCFMQHLPVMDIPDNKYGTCEIGGIGKSIITVASYSTKNKLTKLDGSEYESGFTLDDIAPYSNIGPTVDGRMKPDIAAPGSLIVSAFNGTNSSSEQVAKTQFNGKTYYYGVYQGTSMASPHVAGIVATWLQAYPDLTPDQVREVFANTARHDLFTGTQPNNTWGYGKIDAYNGLLYVLNNFAEGSSVQPIADNNFSTNVIDGKLHVLFFRPSTNNYINVYTASGSLVKSVNAARLGCGDEVIIDPADFTTGIYMVKIATDEHSQTIKLLSK